MTFRVDVFLSFRKMFNCLRLGSLVAERTQAALVSSNRTLYDADLFSAKISDKSYNFPLSIQNIRI